MKKCSKCGCEFEEYEKICPGCGAKQEFISDKYYLILASLSIFCPLFGIIFYFLLRNNKKKLAEVSLKGAIASIFFTTILFILSFFIK